MKYTQLTAADRGVIEVLLREQYSVREIGAKLGRHPATISREINKRSTPTGYHVKSAQLHHHRCRKYSRQKKKLHYSNLQKYVVTKLQLGWSPVSLTDTHKTRQ